MEASGISNNSLNLQTSTSAFKKAVDEQESQVQKLLDSNQEQSEQLKQQQQQQQQERTAQLSGLGIQLDIRA